MRWEAERNTRTLAAVAARNRAEGDQLQAQSEAMESYIKLQLAVARVQELPEIIAADRARRQAERAEELRQLHHANEIAEIRRLMELAHIERELADAHQALKAQRDHGYGRYELEWKKRICEMLELELTEAERREMLREHFAQLNATNRVEAVNSSPRVDDDSIDDALYQARAELLANGLDTSRIDALIGRRRSKEGTPTGAL
jgi:hypothetical protein